MGSTALPEAVRTLLNSAVVSIEEVQRDLDGFTQEITSVEQTHLDHLQALAHLEQSVARVDELSKSIKAAGSSGGSGSGRAGDAGSATANRGGGTPATGAATGRGASAGAAPVPGGGAGAAAEGQTNQTPAGGAQTSGAGSAGDDKDEQLYVPAALVAACDRLTQDELPKKAHADASTKSTIDDAFAPLKPALVKAADDIKTFTDAAKLNVGKLEEATVVPWTVGTCAMLLDWQAQRVTDLDGAEGHAALVEIQYALVLTGKWAKRLAEGQPVARDQAVVEAAQRARTAKDDVDALMQQHGLLNSFSASLFGGTATGSSGVVMRDPDGKAALGGSIADRVVESSASKQIGTVVFESAHWGWEGQHTADWSIRGRISSEQVMTLVSVKDKSDASAGETVVAALQPALTAGVYLRGGFPLERSRSELSLVVGARVARTDDDKLIVGETSDSAVVASPLFNRPRSAWAGEVGFEYTMFNTAVRVVHADKDLVTPAFVVAAGFRRDSRFQQAGSLENLDPDNPDYRIHQPQDRFYFRFMFDLLRGIDRREIGEKAQTFDLGFGVETERAWTSRGPFHVPATMQIVIRGNINLLRAKDAQSSGDDSSDPPKAKATKDASAIETSGAGSKTGGT
jgi:hypothetical protein